MEPGHEDREYPAVLDGAVTISLPQWSPVMKTGNTATEAANGIEILAPQWSPVMKTGNTLAPD